MTRNTFPSAWRKPQKASAGSHVFDILNYLFFGIFTLLCIYPFYYIFINTISDNTLSARGLVMLYPMGLHLDNYVQVMKIQGLALAAVVSVARTVLGTLLTVFASAFVGYLVTKDRMWMRKFWYRCIVATMYFNAGLIPWYILMMNLHLTNNFLAYIIPGIVSPFNIILVKTYSSRGIRKPKYGKRPKGFTMLHPRPNPPYGTKISAYNQRKQVDNTITCRTIKRKQERFQEGYFMKTNRKQILIGLDIGTSSAKCIAIDTSGEVLADCSGEYPMAIPRHGWAEQNPADWWKTTMLCLRKITSSVAVQGNELLGLSLTGQMHGLVALDACDGVIRPAMLWCDQRCQEQCDQIIQLAGGIEGLLSFTNNTMLAGYTGGKLLWLKQKEPDHYERMKIFLCPKDYIRFLLTGEKGMDCSEASGTGFFDTKNRRWNQRLIELAGLRFDIFPEVRESIDLAGRISQKTAELTGLPEGLKVFFGGGDAVTQSTGSGLLEPGTLGIVIGTSGNVSMGLDHFYSNPQGKLQMFCNNEPGRWHVFGAPLSSGGAYRWYRDELGQHYAAEARQSGRNVYSLMDEDAARSVPGSHGVVFTPYLSGERCPYEDSEAKGVLYGLSLGTKRADITRAVMEGVTFSLRQVVELMGRFTECKNAVTSGGGSSSPLWRQMQADILNMPIYTTSTSDAGGAFGAAMLAGVGCGIWRNLSEASSLVKIETETLPDCKNQPAYEDAYAIYARLYPALKPVYSYHRGE